MYHILMMRQILFKPVPDYAVVFYLKDFFYLHLFTIYHPNRRHKPQLLNFNLYRFSFQSLLLTFLLKWLTVFVSGPLFLLPFV
jgi:hypothetical protein